MADYISVHDLLLVRSLEDFYLNCIFRNAACNLQKKKMSNEDENVWGAEKIQNICIFKKSFEPQEENLCMREYVYQLQHSL